MLISPKEIEDAIQHHKESGEIDFKLILSYLNDIKKSLQGLLLLDVTSKFGKLNLFGDIFEFHIHASKDEFGGYVRLTMNDEKIRKKISAMIEDDEYTGMDQDDRIEDEFERNHAIQYQTENSLDPNSLVNQAMHRLMNPNEPVEDTKNMSEKELELLLIDDLNLIENGMTLIKNQYPVDNGYIDILARDKNGILCIIELKVVKDCKDIVYQSVYYPTQFDEDVRMITICPDYNKKISDSLSSLSKVEMKKYSFDGEKIIIIDHKK